MSSACFFNAQSSPLCCRNGTIVQVRYYGSFLAVKLHQQLALRGNVIRSETKVSKHVTTFSRQPKGGHANLSMAKAVPPVHRGCFNGQRGNVARQDAALVFFRLFQK